MATTAAAVTGGTKDASWFGHPKQLARLFSTEAMERFGYYGMRAIVVLYLVQHLKLGDARSNGLWGAAASLIYLSPLIGGLIADRLIGAKKSVKLGAVLMCLGYLTLALQGPAARPFAMVDGQKLPVEEVTRGEEHSQFVVRGGERLQIRGNDDKSVSLLRADGVEAERLTPERFKADAERDPVFVSLMLFGLALIVVGNGFFKPNISTIVGSLYPAGDPRRDAGFTIFYMGINVGSTVSNLACPLLAATIGWWAGFGLAAAGMAIAYLLFQFDGGRLSDFGNPPTADGGRQYIRVIIGALVAVPLVWAIFHGVLNAPSGSSVFGLVLAGTFVLCLVGIPIWARSNGTTREFQMMLAAMVLIFFNVFFWALFEQAASSLTLFAERNTDRATIFGPIPAGAVQTFNPFFIMCLAPIFAVLWPRLAARGLEPSIPVKFAIALVGVGAGYLVLVAGADTVGADFRVGLGWMAALYFIHSAAELCISPIGLSMVTKLSIARIVGLMMGMWFVSISFAQYIGGRIAQAASVETVGGQVTNLEVSLRTYTGVFTQIGLISMGAGVVLFLLSFPLRRWMHGVK
ncbi:MAG: peptide MFS transporter [Sphingomonadaceae bacterium]|nr:peptide MFS transporter [Sphingomonadaceae bacterium]